MQDATVRLHDARARIQSVSEKLLYAGMARSQLTRGLGGEPDIKVLRSLGQQTTSMTDVGEETELMPGDVVEVKLRLDGPWASGDAGSSDGKGPARTAPPSGE